MSETGSPEPTGTPVTSGFIRAETEKLNQCWMHQHIMGRLMAEFEQHEKALLNEAAGMTEAELRNHIGQMAGLRTALTLPHVIRAEAELQEKLEGEETNDHPE